MLETARMAEAIGFDYAMTLKIKTAVSELTRNILKYAERGSVTITPLTSPKDGIKIFVRDNGPGIKDVETALSDNYSTGGTLGLGLPGVKRLMDDFDIDSEHNQGTRITAHKWLD
jgi:serine/threonine-protein kinase RsbT